ncbi:MAG: hypothetical protein MJZ16_07915, partial [Bacteroidales bacterium]|nr:hypothetical protein [Bacteroidales bacterium]
NLSNMNNTISKSFIVSLLAIPFMCGTAAAQTNGAVWSQTIERALGAHGINATASTDIQNGGQTLHLTIDGKTVREPVIGNGAVGDYSSTVYVIIDGIESRSRFMNPVTGNVTSQIRAGSNVPSRTPSRQPSRPADKYSYDPVREWHSKSGAYKPDEVFEDMRDLDLLAISLERAIGSAVRVKLVDPMYANTIPVEETLLLLRTRVIDLQRGFVYEKPKEGEPAPSQPKVARKLAYANVNLQFVNDANGQVVWQGTIEDNDYTSSSYTDPMESCLNSIASRLTRVLNEMYPYTAPRLSATGLVTEMSSDKKEKANTVFINMGTDQELVSGDGLTVYLEQTVGGNVGSTQTGTLTVSEVQGATLSLCKVKKGEKEIYSAIQSGQTLVVKTTW